jgi:superoxide reductase
VIHVDGGEGTMKKVGQKYRCSTCGNEVVVTNVGPGTLVCCGRPMDLVGEGFECKPAV